VIKRLLVAALALVVVGTAGVAYALFHKPTPDGAVTIEVAQGLTTTEIAQILIDNDVISNRFAFRVMAKVRGLDGKIEAGRYEMRKLMGVQAALDVLSEAPKEKGVNVTVPPGYTFQQIAERVGEHTQITKDAFVRASMHARLPAVLMESAPSVEGVLFPETYLVGEHETADQLVARMEHQFEASTRSLDWSQAAKLGVSRYGALIVASLIEREAKVPEDRAKISAVIYNRLRKHMRLQIDATVLYGIPHKVPTLADLRRPSPYNTYLIDGLPPTPIANPALPALEAALHPAHTNDIYYVVCETSGQHCFTDSAQEFQRLLARRPPGTH
jgi:UPF0755 protein